MTRAYQTQGRDFTVVLSGRPNMVDNSVAWSVEAVTENGREVPVPGLENIVSSHEAQAYARACDKIDRWLDGRAGS